MESGIYQIGSKSVKGKFYIGSSVNVIAREKQHFRDLRCGAHSNKNLQTWFDKYGISDLKFKVLQFCPRHKLRILEQKYIDALYPEFNIHRIASRKGYNGRAGLSCKKQALKDIGTYKKTRLISYERKLLSINRFIINSFDDFNNIDDDYIILNNGILQPDANKDRDESNIRKMLLEDIKTKYHIINLDSAKFKEVSNNVLHELLVFGEHKHLLANQPC